MLCFGLALIALSLSLWLGHLKAAWDMAFSNEMIYWNNIVVAPVKDARISKLDDATLVIRSTSHPYARLTLFTRDIDDSKPEDLVKDLCGRDNCVYFPLEDPQRNGAIADYRSGTPMRIVLMHPWEQGVWLEYKGSPEAFDGFVRLIDAIVAQIHEQSIPGNPT